MFDTSYIRPRALAAPRRYGLLTASIGLHSGVAIALIAMSIATVEFPDRSPDQTDAVERWTFAPGTLRGQSVETYFELTVTFKSR